MKQVVIVASLMMVIGVGTQLNAATQITSESQFNSVISSNPKVLVMIGSDSCPHCRNMKPIVNQLSNELGNVVVAFVEAASPALTSLMNKLQVRGIPQFKVYKNGTIVGSAGGEQSKSQLMSLINK